MEEDCIYAKKCHKCQIYRDKIQVHPSPLHVMTSPWPFSMWGMNWVEAALYANVTKSTVSKFLKKEIICRYGMPERLISDNALNLNNNTTLDFKIKYHNSSPYRPKKNEAVEAAKKNIKRIVGKMTKTYKDWHEKLPFSLYWSNSSLFVLWNGGSFTHRKLKLDEVEWIQSRYDQLNLIEEKRLKVIRHGQMYQK
ncbi:RNA-directed DNA polymerase [Gossypium australe]|uniref:RNA-directed DNA polymerase n=1 Tax=Gossypium australe TaxID=47621 RepID=A0A5B6WI82_9ROSI|nr:RNA-directed DNA polymerase [Gossypium australe]